MKYNKLISCRFHDRASGQREGMGDDLNRSDDVACNVIAGIADLIT